MHLGEPKYFYWFCISKLFFELFITPEDSDETDKFSS